MPARPHGLRHAATTRPLDLTARVQDGVVAPAGPVSVVYVPPEYTNPWLLPEPSK